MRKFILCLMLTVALPACGTAPPEMYQGAKMQEQALVRVQEGRVRIIQAYHKELLAAYTAQIDLIAKSEIQKATTNGSITVVDAERIMALKDAKRAEFTALLETKRDEFLQDDNLDIAVEINKVTSAWIKTYVEDFARRIDELIAAGKAIYDQKIAK